MIFPDIKIVLFLGVPAKSLHRSGRSPVASDVLPRQPAARVLSRAQRTWKRLLLGIGHFDMHTDFRHIPRQSGTGRSEVATDPKNVRPSTQACGFSPCFRKNTPDGPGLIKRRERHPPNRQPGDCQSVEDERTKPVALRLFEPERFPYRNNAVLRMKKEILCNHNVKMMFSLRKRRLSIQYQVNLLLQDFRVPGPKNASSTFFIPQSPLNGKTTCRCICPDHPPSVNY